MQNASGDVVRVAQEAPRNEFGMDGLGNVHVVRASDQAEVEEPKTEEPQVRAEPDQEAN